MAYIILISLGFIPSLAWLFFFLKEDIHPEPKKMIVKVFVAGAVITFIAIFLLAIVVILVIALTRSSRSSTAVIQDIDCTGRLVMIEADQGKF